MKYVALLRGIAPMNPNMKNERLRGVFEELGFRNVSSVISSGNILFESSQTDIMAMETLLEKAWPERLGFASTTIIRSQDQIQELIELKPFGNLQHSPQTNLNVTFLKQTPKLQLIYPFQPEGRDYNLVGQHNNVIFSVIDITAAKTPDLMVWLEKQFGKQITTRTWKTIQRIHAKLSDI